MQLLQSHHGILAASLMKSLLVQLVSPGGRPGGRPGLSRSAVGPSSLHGQVRSLGGLYWPLSSFALICVD